MVKNETKLQKAKKEVLTAIRNTNNKIEQLGEETNKIYNELFYLQVIFDLISNMPRVQHLQIEEMKKVQLSWKDKVEKIEVDYKVAASKNVKAGVAGAGAGVAVVALGPSAAMGVATTFGVASTGTAISALSGAAATNAALGWLGGGAITAGGGGMLAGKAILALAGPVGWAIAGAALLSSGVLFWKNKNKKEHLENIFTLVSERNIKSYELAIVELNERIGCIKDETIKLHKAVAKVKDFGLNYDLMSEQQQYELGSYVNLLNSSTQLLVNPILGLQPKYTEKDFKHYLSTNKNIFDKGEASRLKEAIIFLSNLFYKIELDRRDKKLICKLIKKNKEFLESMKISKKDFDISVMNKITGALLYKYRFEKE